MRAFCFCQRGTRIVFFSKDNVNHSAIVILDQIGKINQGVKFMMEEPTETADLLLWGHTESGRELGSHIV